MSVLLPGGCLPAGILVLPTWMLRTTKLLVLSLDSGRLINKLAINKKIIADLFILSANGFLKIKKLFPKLR